MKYQRLKALLFRNRRSLLYTFVLGVLLLFPALFAPVLRKVFTDHILLSTTQEWLPTLLAVMLGMAVFSGVVTYLQNAALLNLSNKIEIVDEGRYFWRLFHAPLKRFLSNDTFILIERADDTRAVTKLLTQDVLRVLFSVVNVALYLYMMLQVDALMTLIVLALVVLSFVMDRANGTVKKKMAARGQATAPAMPAAGELRLQEERVGFEGMQNIEVMRATVREQHFFERLMGIKNAHVMAGQDGVYQSAYSPVNRLPQILFVNLLLLISALRIMDKQFTVGAYLAFSAYAGALFAPMNQLLSIRSLLAGFEGKLASLAQDREGLVEHARNHPEHDVRLPGAKLDGHIELRNVSFAYDEAHPVLTDFSLSIRPGERTAIVGKSGAGKTTVLSLLMGLLSPDAGEVLIDGMPVHQIDRDLFISSIGCANQRISIFSTTIRQNIALWDESVTDEDIHRAAQDATLHTYVNSLHGTYDYQLTEGGLNFSGGQRQKLELARALLYDPTILFLDEAMTSLDTLSIRRVEEALLRRGCTTVVTGHTIGRLSSYDRILVMDEGRIIGQGKHEQLLQSTPLYAALYETEKGQVAI